MTVKRLEELKNKFSNGKGNTEDLGEILTDFFQTFSSYIKELKKEISEIKNNQEILYNDIQDIKIGLNPVYTIIQEDVD